jgi:hypothetical protein
VNQVSKNTFLKAVIFLFCGIPGVLVFAFCSILLLGVILYPSSAESLPHPIFLIMISPGGLLLALIGAGRLRQWLYAFVLLAIPISFFLFGLIDKYFNISRGKGLLELGIFICIVTFLLSKAVRRHYDRLEEREGS